jgi:ferric-dicitrate binding protein FerR (iron transport regulator)
MDIRETYGADERFTPEEAVEILKRAVALEKDQFSTEDLYEMGREAGVSREAVQRAITEYRELQRQLEAERERREQQLEAERLRREARTGTAGEANGLASACVSFKWLFWWSCFSGFLR